MKKCGAQFIYVLLITEWIVLLYSVTISMMISSSSSDRCSARHLPISINVLWKRSTCAFVVECRIGASVCVIFFLLNKAFTANDVKIASLSVMQCLHVGNNCSISAMILSARSLFLASRKWTNFENRSMVQSRVNSHQFKCIHIIVLKQQRSRSLNVTINI